MEIRQIKDNEKALVQDLRDYSFTSVYKGEKLEDFQYWLDKCDVLSGFIEGELAGQVFIFPLNMTLRNQNHAMGGIGFVATDPIFRNRGVMKQLMIASLVQMRENKQVISVLAHTPYRFSVTLVGSYLMMFFILKYKKNNFHKQHAIKMS